MHSELIIPFVGLGGIIISAVISWLISKYQVKSGIEKVRYELQSTYVLSLQNDRLKSYPEVYCLIEAFVKSIQQQEITFNKVKEFNTLIDTWHSKNGLILSFDTNGRFYKLLRKLRRISISTEEAWKNRIEDDKKRQELIREIWEVELGLKNDIGVFQIEFFDPEKKLKAYHDQSILENG